MDRLERISNRLPRFYKHWEQDSLVFTLLEAVIKQLDEAEERITDMMKAHWVDTAVGDELDKLGDLFGLSRLAEEKDAPYRARLKRAVTEYEGGGTVSTILAAVKALIRAQSEEDVQIIENPPTSASAEFVVRAGDKWTLGSNSIEDAQPNLTMTVEETGGVSNPQVMNLDTGESITFKGKLKSGQKLVIKKKKALIDDQDISQKVSPQTVPQLLRRGSTWKYSESLEKLVGLFDTAKFDEHTFAVKIPAVKIRFEWTRLQPATFEVRIKSKALEGSGYSVPYLENVVNSMKAAGVNAIINVSG
jgi:hypothetical protein